MKYSVFTVQMPEYDLEQCVSKLRECGYDGIEWRIGSTLKTKPDPLPPKSLWYWQYNKATVDLDTILEQTDYLDNLAKKYGLETVSLTTYLTPDMYKQIEQVLQAAKKLHCRMIRVMPPVYNGTIPYPKMFSMMRNHMEVMEKMARQYNVQVNIEIHMGNVISSASAACRLLEGLDSTCVGVIYDAGNMVQEGFEQYKMGIEMLGSYLHHIHIKDCMWQKNTVNEFMPLWTPVGSGMVKFDNLISAIKSAGYDQYLSFEDFSEEHDIDTKLKNNLAFIKNLVQKTERRPL